MLISKLLAFYRPAPHAERLSAERIDHAYRRYRLQVMLTIFFGYAGYYIVRKNFSLAKPYLIREYGFTTGDVGLIAAGLSVAYGVSKFVMGNVSDRSNPRFFMATGLILSGVINLFFGFVPSVALMAVLWFINGWFQGMGWAPCARTLTHWFSDGERGTKFALWNIAHNVGGGIVGPVGSLAIILFAGWTSVFYVPAAMAIAMGLLIIIFLRDTPQSVGLPPIEEYTHDYPHTGVEDRERELGSKEILLHFVLNNRYLWILALANVFVYVVRYGVLDWAPTYLTAVKGSSDALSRFQFFVYEYAGIPGTLLAGWLSDRYFSGRRAPVSVIYMFLVTAAVVAYWLNPPGNPAVDSACLFLIGFLIYGPVMLIGVGAVDLVPKKAAGTAAGFTGLFGYMGGAVIAELGIGKVVQFMGWDGGIYMILASCGLSIILLALTWKAHDRRLVKG
ncbi:MAG: MFS transporter [Spirochaetes bacterium]|nr:MFS transporter [Spirochaetota bacterium]